jgi:hypothetical protein
LGWEIYIKIHRTGLNAQINGEAVGPVGGETSGPRFLAVVYYQLVTNKPTEFFSFDITYFNRNLKGLSRNLMKKLIIITNKCIIIFLKGRNNHFWYFFHNNLNLKHL